MADQLPTHLTSSQFEVLPAFPPRGNGQGRASRLHRGDFPSRNLQRREETLRSAFDLGAAQPQALHGAGSYRSNIQGIRDLFHLHVEHYGTSPGKVIYVNALNDNLTHSTIRTSTTFNRRAKPYSNRSTVLRNRCDTCCLRHGIIRGQKETVSPRFPI